MTEFDEAEFMREWERRHADPAFHRISEKEREAVLVYFRARLIEDVDDQPSHVAQRAALDLLEDWTDYRDPEDPIEGDGPLPPDLAAHANVVVPGGSGMEEGWTWAMAAFMIGCNHRTMARLATKDGAGKKMRDALLLAISAVAAADIDPSEVDVDEIWIVEMMEAKVAELKAMFENYFGEPPDLLDPSLWDVDDD